MLPSLHNLMRCSSSVLQQQQNPQTQQTSMGSALSTSKRPAPFSIIDDPNTATCSGRGDCLNGTCLCEIRYAGDECSGFNFPYYVGISAVFYFVALVSVIQLLICIVAEYQRLKQPSVLRACRITTQKMLYFMVFIAASLRGAFFTTPVSRMNLVFVVALKIVFTFFLQLDLQPQWAVTLMSAYYPLLMTCASLIVCMWAEVS